MTGQRNRLMNVNWYQKEVIDNAYADKDSRANGFFGVFG